MVRFLAFFLILICSVTAFAKKAKPKVTYTRFAFVRGISHDPLPKEIRVGKYPLKPLFPRGAPTHPKFGVEQILITRNFKKKLVVKRDVQFKEKNILGEWIPLKKGYVLHLSKGAKITAFYATGFAPSERKQIERQLRRSFRKVALTDYLFPFVEAGQSEVSGGTPGSAARSDHTGTAAKVDDFANGTWEALDAEARSKGPCDNIVSCMAKFLTDRAVKKAGEVWEGTKDTASSVASAAKAAPGAVADGVGSAWTWAYDGAAAAGSAVYSAGSAAGSAVYAAGSAAYNDPMGAATAASSYLAETGESAIAGAKSAASSGAKAVADGYASAKETAQSIKDSIPTTGEIYDAVSNAVDQTKQMAEVIRDQTAKGFEMYKNWPQSVKDAIHCRVAAELGQKGLMMGLKAMFTAGAGASVAAIQASQSMMKLFQEFKTMVPAVETLINLKDMPAGERLNYIKDLIYQKKTSHEIMAELKEQGNKKALVASNAISGGARDAEKAGAPSTTASTKTGSGESESSGSTTTSATTASNIGPSSRSGSSANAPADRAPANSPSTSSNTSDISTQPKKSSFDDGGAKTNQASVPGAAKLDLTRPPPSPLPQVTQNSLVKSIVNSPSKIDAKKLPTELLVKVQAENRKLPTNDRLRSLERYLNMPPNSLKANEGAGKRLLEIHNTPCATKRCTAKEIMDEAKKDFFGVQALAPNASRNDINNVYRLNLLGADHDPLGGASRLGLLQKDHDVLQAEVNALEGNTNSSALDLMEKRRQRDASWKIVNEEKRRVREAEIAGGAPLTADEKAFNDMMEKPFVPPEEPEATDAELMAFVTKNLEEHDARKRAETAELMDFADREIARNNAAASGGLKESDFDRFLAGDYVPPKPKSPLDVRFDEFSTANRNSPHLASRILVNGQRQDIKVIGLVDSPATGLNKRVLVQVRTPNRGVHTEEVRMGEIINPKTGRPYRDTETNLDNQAAEWQRSSYEQRERLKEIERESQIAVREGDTEKVMRLANERSIIERPHTPLTLYEQRQIQTAVEAYSPEAMAKRMPLTYDSYGNLKLPTSKGRLTPEEQSDITRIREIIQSRNNEPVAIEDKSYFASARTFDETAIVTARMETRERQIARSMRLFTGHRGIELSEYEAKYSSHTLVRAYGAGAPSQTRLRLKAISDIVAKTDDPLSTEDIATIRAQLINLRTKAVPPDSDLAHFLDYAAARAAHADLIHTRKGLPKNRTPAAH